MSKVYLKDKNLTPEEKQAAQVIRDKEAEERLKKWEEEQRLAIPREIEKLRQETTVKAAEADRLSKLFETYPDLRKHTGRWGKVAYYSKSANEKATGFDIRHNCGCCDDSPLEVWPYLDTEHGRIYSDPPSFQVGERHRMGGDMPYSGWREKLRSANIPEAILTQVAARFTQDREERIAAASEEGEGVEDEL